MDKMESGDYMCIDKPFWAFKEEHEDSEELATDDEDEEGWPERKMRQAFLKTVKDDVSLWTKPPSEHPECKWVMMKDAWFRLDKLTRRTEYCDPFNFPTTDFYSHYHSWGVNALLESEVRPLFVPV